jgi:radical SAM protein with 4Fe4S-binding SPASM domain
MRDIITNSRRTPGFMGSPMSEERNKILENRNIPIITDQWKIRNDHNYIVAYKYAVIDQIYKPLNQLEATIILLIDGINTVGDIKNVCLEIYDPPTHLRHQFLNHIDQSFNNLMSLEGFISLKHEVSPYTYKFSKYSLPDFANYSFPVTRLERPISAYIAFTDRCLCNCLYCYAEKRICKEVDLAHWTNVFDEFYNNEIFHIDIVGGDLFARDDAINILREMVAREFIFFLSTKSFINQQNAELLAEMGIGVPENTTLNRGLQLSIDSAEDHIASFLVNRPNYLKQVTETTINLLRVGVHPRIKCVLTSYNSDAPEQLICHFEELGVTDFAFAYYSRSHYRHDNNLFLSTKQKSRLSETINRLKLDFPSINIAFKGDGDEPNNTKYEMWKARAYCSGGRTNMVIQPNGDVILCDQVPCKEPFIIGNVFEQGVMGVWKSKKLTEFIYPKREKFIGKVCFNCPEFDDCHQQKGYCYRAALFSYGSIYDAPPQCPLQNEIAPRQI